MARHRQPKKHHRLGKIIFATMAILVLFIIWNVAGVQPVIPKQNSAKISLSDVDSNKQPVSEQVKLGVTPFMTKLHTVTHIEEIVERHRRNPKWTQLSQIPRHTWQALIAIEDHNFFEHGALDITGIIRAALVNATEGKIVQGGSTLTQQLVKNLFLSDEQSLARKIQEAALAFQLERKYTKNDILELYLNTTYLGAGAYGIREAAEAYFDKEPSELKLGESCMLAALPYAPTALNPFTNPSECQKRMTLVLDAMEKHGFIDARSADQARFGNVELRDGRLLAFN